jgi:hypothetical protein
MRRGSYVRAIRPIAYAPYTLIVKGEIARVVCVHEGLTILRLEREHPGLGAPEHGNTVTLVPEDADGFQPCVSPVALRRATGTVATATLVVASVILMPHIAVTPKPISAATVERAYLNDGPPLVRRVVRCVDGTYTVVSWARPRPGRPYGEMVSVRKINAADVEAELDGIGGP